MTYVSPADIRSALAPDGSVVGSAGELSDDQLQENIERGQNLVDATTGYAFNDGNVPPLIRGLVLAFGSYYATLAYRKGKGLEATHPVYLQYVDARQILTDIKTGQLEIVPTANVDPSPTEPVPTVFNSNPGRLFTKRDLGIVRTVGNRYEITEAPPDVW